MGTLFNSLLILSVLNYSGKNTRFIVFAKAYYRNSRYGWVFFKKEQQVCLYKAFYNLDHLF